MSQIRKEAFVWHRLGVDTPEAADAHVRTLSALRDREKSILPRLGIAGRLPVEAERKYISSWVEMGFDDDAIALAYERTVLKKGSLVWPYMNSILKSWHQKKQEQITHPYLEEKIPWGLVPYVQALILARYLRDDLDAYPPFLWK